uniref:Unkown protein n=1 Tax=Riptortus pedestris TaxID=329032 RepID=R4WDF3_RIPPE|nr:unkown protein [Riptortus pedestris]
MPVALIHLFLCSITVGLAAEEVLPSRPVHVQLLNETSTLLECDLTGLSSNPVNKVTVGWFKGEHLINASLVDPSVYGFLGDNKLIVHDNKEDFSKYRCVILKNSQDAVSLANEQPTAKIISSEQFTEGSKIHLECLIHGMSSPTVEWVIGNNSYRSTDGRIKLFPNRHNVPNAVLEIESSVPSDRGMYYCKVTSSASERKVEASVLVRVRSKLATLWPFLGICVQVALLCAIIILCERRRSRSAEAEYETQQAAAPIVKKRSPALNGDRQQK